MRKQVRGLYRRKGSPIWRYDFIIDGHRFSGSTETGDRREAERFVAKLRADKATDVAQLSGKSGMTFAAAATRWWTEAGQHRKDARDMVRALASAGLSGIRLHDTRHTAASRVLAETGSLTAAQRMLGHKDIKTTQRYAHLSDDQLRAALNAADPVEKPKKSPKRA